MALTTLSQATYWESKDAIKSVVLHQEADKASSILSLIHETVTDTNLSYHIITY